MDRILLITKDAMCRDYLPTYGNRYWNGKTPNIDELANKGTIFERYYTAAPSTVMAFRSMVTGKFAHETLFSDYIPMDISESPSDLFNMAKSYGYNGHLIWDQKWVRMVLRYGDCFGHNITIHNIEGLNQPVGPHCDHRVSLENDDQLLSQTIANLEKVVNEICESEDNIFLWIHLPHVISGRTGYGEDIDAFDKCIGMLRKYFNDDRIYISADHGNMDGYHGKYSYGFDVYQPAIAIPLIAPRINGMQRCLYNVSNVDIKTIIFEHRIPEREYIFSDCAYYAQPHRKLAIVKDDFVYIYNKKDKTEELYDLQYDWYERCNMISDLFFDKDRKLNTLISEVYFSPNWKQAVKIREEFRKKKNEIWRNTPFFIGIRGEMISLIKKVIVILKKAIRR